MNFEKFFSIVCESTKPRTDSVFRKQFIGALSIVFDIDLEDIIDDDNIMRSHGNKIGLNSLGIGDYWFSSKSSMVNCLTCKFFLKYKGKIYQTSLRTYNWKKEPNRVDFEKSNSGKWNDLVVQRVPSDFSLPFSAAGEIIQVDENGDWVFDSSYYEKTIHFYPDHFQFQNVGQLASRIKSLIDGYNDGGDRERDTSPRPSSGKRVEKRDLSFV